VKSVSRAVAYPGLPVIFAEGYRDAKRRSSWHSHASLALTDTFDRMRTETVAEPLGEGISLTINGKSPSDQRSQATRALIDEIRGLAAVRTGLKITSENHEIVTGSSDSGAAALVLAINDLLEINLSQEMMVKLAHKSSETAYRSIIGGLSECIVAGDRITAKRLAKPSFFDDMLILGIPYDLPRHSADDLHRRVVSHPHYCERTNEVMRRLGELSRIVEEKDLIGFMQLMEADARTVHTMFSEIGLQVIKPKMKEATDLVEGMREDGIQAYWNVAGGSQVYVFTLKKYGKDVTRRLKDKDLRYRNYKVADGAKIIG